MKRLLEFYETRMQHIDESDFLTQVGHTLNGRPISREQLDEIVDHIFLMLELKRDDRVLNLCCGSGLIISRIADSCQFAFGVDFTSALIDVANKNLAGPNSKFRQVDMKQLDRLGTDHAEPFNKVLFYAALKHFKAVELCAILSNLKKLTRNEPIIVLGFIPLWDRKWAFYNTWSKRFDYLNAWRGAANCSPIGGRLKRLKTLLSRLDSKQSTSQC